MEKITSHFKIETVPNCWTVEYWKGIEYRWQYSLCWLLLYSVKHDLTQSQIQRRRLKVHKY